MATQPNDDRWEPVMKVVDNCASNNKHKGHPVTQPWPDADVCGEKRIIAVASYGTDLLHTLITCYTDSHEYTYGEIIDYVNNIVKCKYNFASKYIVRSWREALLRYAYPSMIWCRIIFSSWKMYVPLILLMCLVIKNKNFNRLKNWFLL